MHIRRMKCDRWKSSIFSILYQTNLLKLRCSVQISLTYTLLVYMHFLQNFAVFLTFLMIESLVKKIFLKILLLLTLNMWLYTEWAKSP